MPRKKVDNQLKTKVYNTKGEVVGSLVLPAEIFAASVSPKLVNQAVRVYSANRRSGTASVQTRGQTTGSTRKIYRQKGTGRARHGDIKAPIFIGGGRAHGPHPRDYSLDLPTSMRRKALFATLTDKLGQDSIKIVKGLEDIDPKTKKMVEVLKNLSLIEGKNIKGRILLILPQNSRNIVLAGRNIDYLTIQQARLLNAYTIITHKNLLFSRDAVGKLSDTFITKEKKAHEREVKKEQIMKSNIKIKSTTGIKGTKSTKGIKKVATKVKPKTKIKKKTTKA